MFVRMADAINFLVSSRESPGHIFVRELSASEVAAARAEQFSVFAADEDTNSPLARTVFTRIAHQSAPCRVFCVTCEYTDTGATDWAGYIAYAQENEGKRASWLYFVGYSA